ncbi:MAG: SIMPL domain-containing protein [Pseudomonadota bacterium]
MMTRMIPAAAMLAACSAPPAALASDNEAKRTITVNGQGQVFAEPDMAVLRIGVVTAGADAKAALSANSASLQATIDNLKAMDVDAKDIQTSGLSISPQYKYNSSNRRTSQINGYEARNGVTVKLRDLDKAGEIVDASVGAGANSLNGFSFTFADPAPLYDAARIDAVKQAQTRAKLLADAAGVNLGALLTIQDGYASIREADAVVARGVQFESASAPIETGESSVSASVTLVYAIE